MDTNGSDALQNATEIDPESEAPSLTALVLKYGFPIEIPVVSIIATLACCLSLIVLVNPKLSGGIYKLLLFKDILELVISMTTALIPLYYCTGCSFSTSLPVVVYNVAVSF